MASSSSSPTPTVWDVFLSFRGADTRNGFTSHLYDSLHRTGIRTFIDEPELRAGDVISLELHNAIKQSKIYIVILSENYASSVWCLDELVEILKRWKSSGRMVLPIFYKIQPAVVRYQLWKFGEALGKHESRVDRKIIKIWRNALQKVGDFSGYHVSHVRTEADIINEVVHRVLEVINPATLEVAHHLVGINSRVISLKSLLGNGSGVHLIGIYGMGGVGKTTLAIAFYNQMSRDFDGSCFLANIKDVCMVHKGLESLQQQLIDDVLKRKNTATINNIYQGINTIRERICSLKVLVVLDDIDHQDQVNYLVGKFLAAGSVIVLTTRNEDLLDSFKVEAKYKVDLLDDIESRKLFNQHAFEDPEVEVSSEVIVMSDEILRHAEGLPLALTVFGSILFNQKKDKWAWFVDRLQRAPVNDVEKKLTISVEALKQIDPKLQDFFLDIACFFVGKRKYDAVKILETCYGQLVNHYINMLKKRCLITINEHNALSMHNLLSGMGREIAHNSRLFGEDIRDVLENNKGIETIEGMVDLNEWEDLSSYSCDAETFNRMPKLRFLRLLGVNIRGSFGMRFNDLRWLCWYGCTGLPSNFSAEKLVILELPCNSICRFTEKAMVLGNLKILDMSNSYQLSKTPDFNGLKCLETLLLCECDNLVEIDASIGNLVRLATLDLTLCTSLRRLPKSICILRALKSLYLTSCSSLKALPMELGNIESLTDLKADKLMISQLPDSLGHLGKLVTLNLKDNTALQTIPDTICNLRSLESLNISGCSRLEALPTQLGKIESLIELDASGTYIFNLPYSIGSLRKLVKLHLSLCMNLTSLPELICKLRSLEILKIIFIRGPNELACGCTIQLSNPQLPSTLIELEKLHPFGCSSLREMEGLDRLISIKELHLEGLTDIQDGTSMKVLPNVSYLHLSRILHLQVCSSLRQIEGLEKLISVEKLHFEGLTSMNRLPKLSNLKQLQTLWLKNCSRLIEIEGLDEVLSIARLDIRGCTSLKRLPNLSNLQQLETLLLMDCSSLTKIKGLEKIISLTQLTLGGCKSMKRLPNLSNLQQLKTLRLSGCSSLTEIQGLEEVISIIQLDLSGCISLKKLPNLSNLQQLEHLLLTDCSNLTEIEGVEKLISIRELHLGGCKSIKGLPNLSNLQQLSRLQLYGCSSLMEIEGLEKLISVTLLDLTGCISLKSLPDLSNLQQLDHLLLTYCSNLTEIEGVEKLSSIRELHLGGCKSLKRLPNLSNLKHLSLDISQYLVGINSRVASLKSLLGSGSTDGNGVNWIGIHGMGGVGKTTLAKALYNQISGSFDGSCFLTDIKNICAGSECHVSLQQKLINDVLKRATTSSTTINNIDQGINLIRHLIVSRKVLVVLDDIDNQDQVNYLVGKFLAAGSVIVLTTRNGDLLDKLGVKARYMFDTLDAAESLQLFNQHAFEDTEIKPEFMEMSDTIIRYAGGLPLALKYFGSSLKGAEKEGWELFIDKLQKLPTEIEVLKTLKISYDALESVHPQLQAFFLDIACFFIGMEIDSAVEILQTCYPNLVYDCIAVLTKRCFITINERNELSMHDLMRAMGRKIAGKSRLFASEDIRDVLENNKGTEAIEGIIQLDGLDKGLYSCDAETFNRMPNLRFLRLYNVNMRGSFGIPFKNLRWLNWERCPSLPSNFCAEKLVILDMQLHRNPCETAYDAPPPLENSKVSSVWTTSADGASSTSADLASCSEQAVRPRFIATYHRRAKQSRELKTYQRRGKKRNYGESIIDG